MKEYIYGIFIYLKNSIIASLAVTSIFIGPIQQLIFAVFLLAILDFITGIMASRKKDLLITSKRMGDTFYKFLIYGLTIIIFHYLDENFVKNIQVGILNQVLSLMLDEQTVTTLSNIKMSAGVALLMAIRELKSVDENWEVIFKWSFIKTVQSVFEAFNHLKKLKP